MGFHDIQPPVDNAVDKQRKAPTARQLCRRFRLGLEHIQQLDSNGHIFYYKMVQFTRCIKLELDTMPYPHSIDLFEKELSYIYI